jgi:hypothetical protein
MGSDPDEVEICFMQQPCCYFTLQEELLLQHFVFSENMSPSAIV